MEVSKDSINKLLNQFTCKLLNVENILAEISEESNTLSDFNAIPSILIYLAEYHISDDFIGKIDVSNCLKIYADTLVKILNKNKKINQTFISGITGIVYSFSILRECDDAYIELANKLKNIFIEITKKFIKKLTQENKPLREEHYDFINGLSGNLAVLLAYYLEEAEIITDILKYFVHIFEDADKNEKDIWIRYEQIPNEYMKTLYPEGYINLGVAHGIAMPMFLMTKAYNLKFEVSGLKDTVNSLINVYQKYTMITSTKCHISGIVSSIQTDICTSVSTDRNGWCYGDLSIKALLYYSCESLNRADFIKILESSIMEELQKDISAFNLTSPTFCHGYSGLLLIKTILKQKLECDRYKKFEKKSSRNNMVYLFL